MKKRFEKFIEKHRDKYMSPGLRNMSGLRSLENDSKTEPITSSADIEMNSSNSINV
jgi:hypothetical protein